MKKSLSISIVIIITAALFSACGTGARQIVKPQPVKKPEQPVLKFEGQNIMKDARIYSAGNYISRLIDGNPNSYFIGGNYNRLIIEFGGEVNISGIVISNITGIGKGKADISINHIFVSSTNFNTNSLVWNLNKTDGDVLELLIEGTNVLIGEIEVYGSVVKKYAWSAKPGKPYKMNEKEREKIVISSDQLAKGNYSNAIALNQKLLETNPKDPYANMNLGQIYMEQSKKAEDQSSHLNNVAEGIMRLENADTPENPNRKEALKYLASVYKTELLGSDKVVDYYRKILELEEAVNTKVTESLVKNWAGLSENLAANGNLEESLAYDEKVFEWCKNNSINPDDRILGEAVGSYGTALLREKQWDKMYEVYDYLIKKIPNTEWVKEGLAYHNLALAGMALGRWKDAIEAWKGYYNRGTEKIALTMISYCFNKLSNSELSYNYYLLSIYQESFEKNSKFSDDAIEINKNNIKIYFSDFNNNKNWVLLIEKGLLDYMNLFNKYKVNYLDQKNYLNLVISEANNNLNKYKMEVK